MSSTTTRTPATTPDGVRRTGSARSLPRGRAVRRVAVAVATVLLLSGCTEGDRTTPSAVPSPVDPDAPEASDVPDAEALAAYREAVEATLDASSFTVEAQVEVTTADGPATIDLRATRGEDRRTLQVTTDGGTVIYEVTPEGATVDTGTGTRPVALSEVPDVPGVGALGELDDLRVTSPGVAEGTLSSTGATGTGDGADDIGPVAVTVRYEPGGAVEEVRLVAASGGYEATVRFTDVVR